MMMMSNLINKAEFLGIMPGKPRHGLLKQQKYMIIHGLVSLQTFRSKEI